MFDWRRVRLAIGLVMVLPSSLLATAYLMNWNNEHYYAASNREMNGRQVNVVFLGDSITALWSYPKLRHLMAVHPGYVNRGISGDHAALMVLRMPQDVFALTPRTVVFQGGINDLKARSVPNALRFLMPYEVEVSTYIVTEMTSAHHERLILCSLTPVDEKMAVIKLGLGSDEIRSNQILAVNTWIKSLAQSHGVTYVDYYSAMNDGHDRMRGDLTDDGLHPNDAGFALMEPLIQQAIDRDTR